MQTSSIIKGISLKPNLRELLNVSDKYHTYNREERYYAALLYHFLLKPTELKKFLLQEMFKGFIGQDYEESEVEIYFEYAHIRDLWYTAKEEKNLNNKDLQTIIIKLLAPTEYNFNENKTSNLEEFNAFFSAKSVVEFNEYFGAKSTREIQMPGRWDKKKFSKWEEDFGRTFAESTCKLIWAFNAKADIVIHAGNKAICIEAKVVSAESSYRATAGDADNKDDFVMKQTKIQEFILKNLLGYDTTFVFLSKSGKFDNDSIDSPSIGMRWEDVFALMYESNELQFVRDSMKSKIISDTKKKKNENG